MTIGICKTPVCGRKGWLKEPKSDAAHEVDDLFAAMDNDLSVDGKRFPAQIYGESSMLMCRTDLAHRTGINLAERSTWSDVKQAVGKLMSTRLQNLTTP